MSFAGYMSILKAGAINESDWTFNTDKRNPDYPDPNDSSVPATIPMVIPGDRYEIQGPAEVTGHEYSMEIKGFRFDLGSQAKTNAYGLSVFKDQDETSPKLAWYCCTRKSLAWVQLVIDHGSRTRSGTPSDHKMVYILKDASITKLQSFFGSGQFAHWDSRDQQRGTFEEVILGYKQITWQYFQGSSVAGEEVWHATADTDFS